MKPVITIERTTDEPYIKSVFLDPTIYASMKDDSCPESPMILAAVDIKAIPGFFLRVLVDSVPCGCFWLIWRGSSLEGHTALLSRARGRIAVDATLAAIRWVFGNTDADKITSYAWSDSPAVAWFCRAVGMSPTRTERWPNTRDGKPVGITYFEIGRVG